MIGVWADECPDGWLEMRPVCVDGVQLDVEWTWQAVFADHYGVAVGDVRCVGPVTVVLAGGAQATVVGVRLRGAALTMSTGSLRFEPFVRPS